MSNGIGRTIGTRLVGLGIIFGIPIVGTLLASSVQLPFGLWMFLFLAAGVVGLAYLGKMHDKKFSIMNLIGGTFAIIAIILIVASLGYGVR